MRREDIIRERKGYKYRRQEGKITVRMFERFIRNYCVNYLKNHNTQNSPYKYTYILQMKFSHLVGQCSL